MSVRRPSRGRNPKSLASKPSLPLNPDAREHRISWRRCLWQRPTTAAARRELVPGPICEFVRVAGRKPRQTEAIDSFAHTQTCAMICGGLFDPGYDPMKIVKLLVVLAVAGFAYPAAVLIIAAEGCPEETTSG